MPTLQFTFPGRRYHATLWGHHANEGLIEWPPCPWRILRALLACGFNKLGWRDVSDLPPLARSLLEKLASTLPSYHLPEASAAHTRHYMPYISGKDQKTTLVWDTFADVGDGELLVHYPCELDADEHDLLAILTRNLGYLGRAESWVDGALLDGSSFDTIRLNAFPCDSGDHPGQKYEQIALTAPIPPVAYLAWQRDKAESAIAHLDLPRTAEKPRKAQLAKLDGEKRNLQEPFPPDLLSCLTKDTSWWKGHGWSQPPGSQRVLYWRPSDPLQVGVPVRRRQTRATPVEAMLLAITTPSGRQSPLPNVSRTLPQAELIHRALIGILGKGERVDCPELTGKDEHDQPLRNAHQHAHVLPLDLDKDRRIDHVLIFAKMGLGDRAQRAISSLRRTWTKGGAGDLQLAVVGKGNLSDLSRLPDPLGPSLARLIGPATTWTTLTPFVPPRFLKKEGRRNDLLHQVQAELASRNLPSDATITVLPLNVDETRPLRHLVRSRKRGNAPPQDVCFAVEIRFATPVTGPLSLGYASHFGMGLFRCR
ncbi:MAG TPA: type I-U CRISPR-associated protein Csb2 [Tepidisphaeraceae bacterium]|jgi:CRISPR-associated protein Csb2|nr:type I-U CRISPR-associated protein Csb2 [Tepidisphaeraceae bacterium]